MEAMGDMALDLSVLVGGEGTHLSVSILLQVVLPLIPYQ
jgi:hypothetical protein